jgi:16S rRNA (uracil1498-N3)-methyltransferase
VGERFAARLPDDSPVSLKIERITPDTLVAALDTPPLISSPFTPSPLLVLFQAIPKAAKMDLIVRQAAEAEVSLIVPFRSEFSVPIVNAAKAKEKAERWRRIAREARQQSGSNVDTVIAEPTDLDRALAIWKDWQDKVAKCIVAVGLFFHQAAPVEGDEPVECSLHAALSDAPETGAAVAYAVGPEGGFSDNEAKRFLDAGFRQVWLGPSVLRVETAALYATAAIRTLLLEEAKWTMTKK